MRTRAGKEETMTDQGGTGGGSGQVAGGGNDRAGCGSVLVLALAVLLMVFVVAGLVWRVGRGCVSACGPDPDYEATTSAQDLVLRQLKSPSTAHFAQSKIVDRTKDTDGRKWFVVYTAVDSQNSFGAMIRSDFLVVLALGDQKGHYRHRELTAIMPCSNPPSQPEIDAAKTMNEWPGLPKDETEPAPEEAPVDAGK
jgi:hypothetical protein